MLISYLLGLFSISYLVFHFYLANKRKKSGQTMVVRPLYLIACVIVLLLALFSIVTGQTYDDIIAIIENTLRSN